MTIAQDSNLTPVSLSDAIVGDASRRRLSRESPLSLLRLEGSSIQCRCPACLTTFDSLRADGAEANLSVLDPSLSNDTLNLSVAFQLHSNPGAKHTIYLDFDGFTTDFSFWENGDALELKPYYSNPNNNTSRAEIIKIWQRVAEDFAPFEVNVTTQEPDVGDLKKNSDQDQRWGIRVAFTSNFNESTDAKITNAGGGGTAFYNSFNWSIDDPVLVFNRGEYAGAETASHEVGHSLNLRHDGGSFGANKTYYEGHGGTALTSWGTIMGAPFLNAKENVTQWSRGEYIGANNLEDDLAIITTDNGFSYRVDDYGNNATTAYSLTGLEWNHFGIIERNTDFDFFSFQTEGGLLNFTVENASRAYVSQADGTFSTFYLDPRGPNLKIGASLYNALGELISASNSVNSLSAGFTDLALTSGQYYLAIDGVGVGNPFSNPPSGFTDYASLGQYRFAGSITPIAPVLIPELSIAATEAVLAEGNETGAVLTFTVTRSVNLNETNTVDWAVTGLDVNELDFTGAVLPSGTLTFNPGEETQVISVNIQGDLEVEADESFTVTLSNASNSAVITTATATGTILNDDVPPPPPVLIPEFAIAATEAVLPEGNETGAVLTFTVTRSVELSETNTVDWAVTGLDVNELDFTGAVLPSGTLTFNPGEETQVISVNIQGDLEVEADETFTVTLTNPTNSAVITANAATGTILNDDVPPPVLIPELSITATSAVLPEGNETGAVLTFTVTRSVELSKTNTVDWAVTGLDVNELDFTGAVLPSGTLTFNLGEETQVISVNIQGDLEVEADETFTVTLSNASNSAVITANTVTGTILNDDVPPPLPVLIPELAISATSAVLAEGNETGAVLTFTVTRSVELSETNAVDWAVTGLDVNELDFTGAVLPSGTLTFNPGEETQVISVNIQGDLEVEGDETFTVTLSNASNSAVITTNTATGTILNDDVPPPPPVLIPELAISATSSVLAEGNETGAVLTFTVTRSVELSETNTVDWAVTGLDVNELDFTGAVLPSGTLTFNPGEETQVISVNIQGDLEVEADENFTVTLTNPTNSAVITANAATGTILNDDVPPPLPSLKISPNSQTILEGLTLNQKLSYTVTLGAASAETVTVDYFTQGESAAASADYLPISGTLTFAPGSTSQTLQVSILDDKISEGDETFQLVLQNPVNAILDDAIAVATITDTLFSATSKTLPARLENLTLTGDGAINATGNGSANRLTGNDQNNILKGGNGLDILAGLGGNDIFDLTGVKANTHRDLITDFTPGEDRVWLSDTLTSRPSKGVPAWLETAPQATLTLATEQFDLFVFNGEQTEADVDLSLTANGAELLDGLNPAAGNAKLLTTTTGSLGYLLAYDNGDAYLYAFRSGADTVVSTSEIALIATFADLAPGTLSAENFELV